MDHGKILRRAWYLTRSYRALWVFGVILALTTFSWETAIFLGRDNSGETSREGITIETRPGETFSEALQRTIREKIDELDKEIDKANQELDEFFTQELHARIKSDIITFLIVLAVILVTAYIAAKIASYVGETALIRMVDETEECGVQHSVRHGFQIGWSRAAGQLFLIDVLVDLSAILAFLMLFLLVLAPLVLWTTGSDAAGIAGTIVTVLLFFPGLALVVVTNATLSMLKQFFRRVCALNGLGVRASIRRGYTVVRQHLREVVPMWLITVGIGLAWPFLMVPVGLLLAGAGVVLGGLSALLVGGLSGLAFGGTTPLILAAIVGVSIFLLALVVPLVFLGGLREVFLSSTWTLTYRELCALKSLEPGQLPSVDAADSETASGT